jgi:hypothetical protein
LPLPDAPDPGSPGFGPPGQVVPSVGGTALNAATGTVIKKVWSGQATALAVGDGRIAVNTDSRILDLFGLHGSG